MKSQTTLTENWITPRRYFCPSLNTMLYVAKAKMPVSESTSSRVLCLPLYHGLVKSDVDSIARLLLRVQNN